jgi:hypothetical protein
MKKIIAIATLVAATSASAGFFNNSNGSNNWEQVNIPAPRNIAMG